MDSSSGNESSTMSSEGKKRKLEDHIIKKKPRIPWEKYNFRQIEVEGVKKSQCLKCKEAFSSRYYKFFENHQKNCTGQSKKENNQNAANTPDNFDKQFNETVNDVEGGLNKSTFLGMDDDVSITDIDDLTLQNVPSSTPNRLKSFLLDERNSMNGNMLSNTFTSQSNSMLQRINSVSSVSSQDTVSSISSNDLQSRLTIPQTNHSSSDSNVATARASNCKGQPKNKDVALMKYFLSQGIDLKSITSVHIKEMLAAFDQKYTVPKPDYFETQILKKAISYNLDEDLQKSPTNVIELLTLDEGTTLFVLTTLLCHDNSSIYLKHKKFGRSSVVNGENENIICADEEAEINWILDKCCESIHIAAKAYKSEVEFVLHDGLFNLPDFASIQVYPDNPTDDSTRPFALFTSLNILIDKLIDLDLPTTTKKRDLNIEYDNQLNELKNRVKEGSLSDGVQELFSFMATNNLLNSIQECKDIFRSTFLEFITSMYFVTNYINPKYRGKLIDADEDLKLQYYNFISSTGYDSQIRPEVLDGLGYYDSGVSEFFKKLLDGPFTADWKKFWMAVKAQKRFIPLSEYAMALLSVPAYTRFINKQELFRALDNYLHINEAGFRSLLYTLWINENL